MLFFFQIVIGSGIKSAKTLPVPIVEPETSIVPLDVGLAVKDVTFNSAFVSWRVFTPDEKMFIDGVQLRYDIFIRSTFC